MDFCKKIFPQKINTEDKLIKELSDIKALLEYQLGKPPLTSLEIELKEDRKKEEYRQGMSHDNSYKIYRINNGQNFIDTKGYNITFLFVPAGDYQLKFGLDNDWIKSTEIQRGDVFFLKFDGIYIQGTIPGNDPLVIYVG